MAPKRHKGETSSGTPAYDKRRFTSYEASEFYHDFLAEKKLIPERGLDPGVLDGKLRQTILNKRWEALTHQPDPAVIPVVKEFYANAKNAKNGVVRVRGKKVSYRADNINSYFNIDNMEEEDDYTTYKDHHFDMTEVINGLCQPGTTWKLKDGNPIQFSYKGLSRYGKAWYYFLCARLMPTTHITDINKERAILLYCLVNNKSINIGKVIQNSIHQTIAGGSTRGLPHPSVICGLCELAEVKWEENEPLQEPQVVIDSKIIRSFTQWGGAQPNPMGAGFILEAGSPDTDELFAASPDKEGDSSTPAIPGIMHSMQQRMDRLAQRQDAMHGFNVNVAQALAQAFSNFQLPDVPMLPEYPPTDHVSGDEA